MLSYKTFKKKDFISQGPDRKHKAHFALFKEVWEEEREPIRVLGQHGNSTRESHCEN